MHPSVLLLFKVEPLFVPSYLCDFGALCLRYNRLAMNAKNIDSVKSFLSVLRTLIHGKRYQSRNGIIRRIVSTTCWLAKGRS